MYLSHHDNGGMTDMKNSIAYCGLDCDACDARKATRENNNALREKTATLWSELNGINITPEMINCDGCRADGLKTPYCERYCEIRQCALGKNVKTCGACENLENCPTVGAIIKTDEQALINLKNNADD